ncbi:MAG TPA: c-type cytochrome [Elusimicrobiota bacterium]|nr:c-type cytochrome [Elusimicrobiota bacterium]
MVKGIVVGAIGIVLAAAAAAWIVISLGYAPANADAKPSRIERFIAARALHAVIRREAPKGPNPVAPTGANVIDGIKLYAENCAVCHGGATGERSNIAQGLYQKPPQFGMHGVEDDPDGFTYWKIAHGIRMTGMPAFDGTLSQNQIWKIALFLKRMNSLRPAAEKAWDGVGD